ncbi:WAS/WASL-interacting protein family member 3 [Cynara cardunculus var. scolymus]|uniref:WAS/WASL-interacting protein family member 3 n=1 Tax=Cynara cardunculus var. scolymus TaxID=59895 RepID=UPI000D624CBA|nr:WAS/WASL-interacting protein family member 3 [Cynara cardunculus var. scolymus]
MSELQKEPSPPPHPADTLPPPPPPASTKSPTSLPSAPPNQPPLHRFDPSRMIGIIKRKALIKDLAAVYHAECLAYCQELLELQKKCEEPYADVKVAADSRKETMRPPKRLKKQH